jgi:hypothetical protein
MSIKSMRLLAALLILACLTPACAQATPPPPTPTPTTDPATPAAATSAAATAAAESTAEAAATQAALAGTATAGAEAALIAGQTATAAAEKTATVEAKNATATANQAAAQTRTAQKNLDATATAEPMYVVVQRLVADGLLTGEEHGKFTQLDDFEWTEAKINYMFSYPSDASPTNFVLRSDFEWDSASNSANWFNSGCGFIFHFGRDGSFYYSYLALDGYVELGVHKPDFTYIEDFGRWYYGRLDTPAGKANFMMVVLSDKVAMYVNDELVHTYHASLKYTEGELLYSLTSGTNKDWGTRCSMTNVWLWDLGK